MTVGELKAYLDGFDDRECVQVVVDFPAIERKYGTARTSTDDIVVCPPELACDYAGDDEPVLLLPADLGGLTEREMMRLWAFLVDWKERIDYNKGMASRSGDLASD